MPTPRRSVRIGAAPEGPFEVIPDLFTPLSGRRVARQMDRDGNGDPSLGRWMALSLDNRPDRWLDDEEVAWATEELASRDPARTMVIPVPEASQNITFTSLHPDPTTLTEFADAMERAAQPSTTEDIDAAALVHRQAIAAHDIVNATLAAKRRERDELNDVIRDLVDQEETLKQMRSLWDRRVRASLRARSTRAVSDAE